MGLGLLSRPPTRAPSSPRAMRLRRLSSGRCVELQEPVARSRGIVLGRSEARTDVVVGDSTKISRTHAVITLTERHEWVIGDLSSTNGLYVNGVLRKRHILKPNDVISFVERCRFGFVFEESPAECPPDNATSDRVGTKRKRSSNDEPDADDVRVSKRQDIMYELTCSICLEPYLDPLTFQCSHSFCQSCIELWLRQNCECPVCRTPVTRDPVPSLSLKNQVERCLSPRDLTAYMTRKADVEKESLRMKRREVKVTSTLAVLHVEKRRIACVFGAWTDANVRLLNKVNRKLYGRSRSLFMAAIGLTEQSIQQRPASELLQAYRNLGGVPPDSSSDADVESVRQSLWRYIRFGSPL
ncbi:E3 ubiquitin-protein ligase CHFR [Plasmodiophora brassicae]|uniref:E3 ubiquitin-protein ligase CHFR n=1 Tax=Plasmodiophora brassicae TaxID=37360 RepID=A0A3P3YEN6_PLABS|nr:unnamed protein product [Plasmodiophora brassicae]